MFTCPFFENCTAFVKFLGKKKDTWFKMDPDTGHRQKILGFDKSSGTCSVDSQKAIYVGRTQYTIMMIDSKVKDKHWNVTFYDYSATQMTKDMLNDYGMCLFFVHRWYTAKILRPSFLRKSFKIIVCDFRHTVQSF